MIIHKLLEGSLQAATWGVGQCHGDGGNDTPLSNTAHFRDEECARWIGGMLRTYTAGNTLGRSVYTADGWGPECTRQGPVWDGECTRPKHPPSCTISVTGDSLPCTLFALFCTRWEPDGDEKCARRGHSLPRLLLVRERSSPCALFGIPGQDGARRVRFPSRTGVYRCGVSRSGKRAWRSVWSALLTEGPMLARMRFGRGTMGWGRGKAGRRGRILEPRERRPRGGRVLRPGVRSGPIQIHILSTGKRVDRHGPACHA